MGATIGRPEKARGRRGRVRSGATRVGTRKAGRIRSVLCPPIDPSAAVSGSTASEARSQPGRERGPHTHATRRREPDPDGDATRDGDPTGQMFVKRLHAPFLERTCACAPVSCGCAFGHGLRLASRSGRRGTNYHGTTTGKNSPVGRTIHQPSPIPCTITIPYPVLATTRRGLEASRYRPRGRFSLKRKLMVRNSKETGPSTLLTYVHTHFMWNASVLERCGVPGYLSHGTSLCVQNVDAHMCVDTRRAGCVRSADERAAADQLRWSVCGLR